MTENSANILDVLRRRTGPSPNHQSHVDSSIAIVFLDGSCKK
ncbi:hypothetical protein RB8520 [Rhodopirellula baltica SH 1]|uniref:Uncharacterized protein n=1 Tax=Rhodopirellula baltica (strain DSM 10527 / NCIMB 13988 / SH1) TaxID=243090 RepID=Q7UFJ6_RHOBA|nr:hypothetical protein RB8520 [Rhodopirellula baltica SH 1]